jgi:D-lactate dehydrogenase (cytochrome)
VRAITVVLPGGDVLDVERGVTTADSNGTFEIVLPERTVRLEIPTYRLPRVPKVSAGYFAAPGMDLIDLFIGSEGTLGVITEATLRVVASRPAVCLAFVPFNDRPTALGVVTRLRDAAAEAWRTADPHGPRCVGHRAHGPAFPRLAQRGRRRPPVWCSNSSRCRDCALDYAGAAAWHDRCRRVRRDRPRARTGGARHRLTRFCRVLDEAGVLDAVEIAVPGDHARAAQLVALREEVPAAVNARVGRAKHDVDSRIAKTAADMIVPFESLETLMTLYDKEFERRGLDAAVWGHISDGNLHPNVIPRSFADVESGKEAILAFGREVIRLGGRRSPNTASAGIRSNSNCWPRCTDVKGIDEMRAIKRALDPEWKMAPGVLFPQQP